MNKLYGYSVKAKIKGCDLLYIYILEWDNLCTIQKNKWLCKISCVRY